MSEDRMEAQEPRRDEEVVGGEPPSAGDTPKRAVWPWVVLGLFVALIALVGWTKTVNSDGYCIKCHSMQAAADTAAHSAHSEVNCISCHQGEGVRGAIRYIPSFVRESIDQVTPIPLARGIMDPAPCVECHDPIFTSPLLKGEHPTTGCAGCHGDPSHPQPIPEGLSEDSPHPLTYVQTHGRDAVKSTAVCATCHAEGYCVTCHFKSEFPHPRDWMEEHGPQQLEQGQDACTLCHPPTFCASCHGTEIPHSKDWLDEHWRELQVGYPTAPCLTCHAETDCTSCHSLHPVHNQQRIYDRGGKADG